jgi:two-component system, sensor histidine kinase LadS
MKAENVDANRPGCPPPGGHAVGLAAAAIAVWLLLAVPVQAMPAFDLAGLERAASLLSRMHYLPDPGGTLTLETVMEAEGWRPADRPRLGYGSPPVWTRLRVRNTAGEERSMVLFNQRPMVNRLDVMVLDQGRVVEEYRLGFMVPAQNHPNAITSRLSSFTLTLAPGSERTILTRLHTHGALELGWEAATVAEFSRMTRRDILNLGLNLGFMLALAAAGLLSWVWLRRPQFGLLVGYTVLFTLYVATINGLSRIASLGLPPEFWFAGSFFFALGSCLFWIPFTQFFLKTGTTMPAMHAWLNILGALLAVSVLCYMVSPWAPVVYRTSPIWIGCVLTLCATVLWTGALAVIRGLNHAWLYLIGHAGMFCAAIFLVILGQSSLIMDFALSLQVNPWIVAAHLGVMVLSLNIMARDAREAFASERRLFLAQSGYAAVGRTVGMIVHQWRTPLARLGTELAELGFYFHGPKLDREHERTIREILLPSMNRSMDILTGTVEDFSDLLSVRRPREDFAPERVVSQVLEMLAGRIQRLGVRVERDSSHGSSTVPVILHGRPTALAHVLMVLTANALDALEVREPLVARDALDARDARDAPEVRTNQKDDARTAAPVDVRPWIKISLEARNDVVDLTVEDNGGGVPFSPPERVFEGFGGETDAAHMGLGLGLARRLVEDVLGGTIDVENTGLGARFTVRMPQGDGGAPYPARPV